MDENVFPDGFDPNDPKNQNKLKFVKERIENLSKLLRIKPGTQVLTDIGEIKHNQIVKIPSHYMYTPAGELISEYGKPKICTERKGYASISQDGLVVTITCNSARRSMGQCNSPSRKVNVIKK